MPFYILLFNGHCDGAPEKCGHGKKLRSSQRGEKMQLGLDRTGRRSLLGDSTVSVFWILSLLTSSTGNAFSSCSLLFYTSTSADLSFMFSLHSLPVSTNADVYKHAPLMFPERKKCQCCKTGDPQELDLPTELSKSYKKSQCLFHSTNAVSLFS